MLQYFCEWQYYDVTINEKKHVKIYNLIKKYITCQILKQWQQNFYLLVIIINSIY